jgi:peptide/nickel transport system permease protein
VLARKICVALGLLWLVSVVAFVLLSLAPGNEVTLLLAGRPHTAAVVHDLELRYHLTGSVVSRYLGWLAGAVHLQFGDSIATQQPVSRALAAAAPITAELAAVSFAIVLALGVPLGTLAAMRHQRRGDRGIVAAVVVGVSTPPYVTGLVLIVVFAVVLHLLPSFGPGGGGVDRLRHLLLPAIALASSALAVVVKVARSAMIRELGQDYVVFARARGISERRIVVSYALRNALIPVVTAAGLVLGYLVGGAVFVEQTFSLPGLGSTLVSAADSRDLPMLQGTVMVIAAAIIAINLATDLFYLALDPRTRARTNIG